MRIILAVLAIVSFQFAFAANDHDHAPAKVSAQFEKMKSLVGTWQGKTDAHGKEEPLAISYELTSGGTALIEKINPGSPMEMVTVYANSGNTVNATHFCMLGNQPQMTLKKSTDNSFSFEMVGTKGVASANEMHMHAVTLTVDGNKLKSEWTSFKDGKKGDVKVFVLTKKM